MFNYFSQEERWQHLDDACYNTKTGSWILATCIETYGYNWKSIGCYNSRTPGKCEAYARKVFDRLKRLESGKEPQPLDSDLKEAIADSIDTLVEHARKGEKKTVRLKFVPYVRVSGKALRYPPDPSPAGKRSAGASSKAAIEKKTQSGDK